MDKADLKGKYIYCILEGNLKQNLGKIGIQNRSVYTIPEKNISAVVSNVPFEEMKPEIEDLIAHQRVVDSVKTLGTVLPVRFGVIFQTVNGIKEFLNSSYEDFVTKIEKFKGKTEIGLKILLTAEGLQKIQKQVEEESEEGKKLKAEISSSEPGRSFFSELRLKDFIKKETFKKIDQIIGEIDQELSKLAEDKCLLKQDIEEIILNTAYLVFNENQEKFNTKINNLKDKYAEKGLIFHPSGPWAPYSFIEETTS